MSVNEPNWGLLSALATAGAGGGAALGVLVSPQVAAMPLAAGAGAALGALALVLGLRGLWHDGGTAAAQLTGQSTREGEPDSVSGPSGFARAALEAAPAPVMIVDQTGRLSAANRAARERFALELNAGETRPRFATQIRRPELVEAVTAVLSGGPTQSFAFDTIVPVERFERATVAAFEADGQRNVLVTLADETQAKMSERMRADFLANASHELRTPLTGISGFIETLRGPARDDPDARERFLEIMHTQADRMSRLISDLLSLSRIELNERVAPTGRADLAAAVQEALEGLSLSPRARQARIEFDSQCEALWVIADWDEIQQVVSNLVDNALKYGRPGGQVRIVLDGWLSREEALRSASRRWEGAARLPLTSPLSEKGRRYAVLRVEDDGPGIERQHLPRLSERFYRVEATAQGQSGTGLGLAIVKHIINRHRGGLMVETAQGKGSAFAVYLRQPEDAAPVTAAADV